MIEIHNLAKTYDNINAINNVSVSIQEGGVFGLVGTNGAGKSTLLRMMCGILRPDFGSILVDGVPVYENESAKRNIFYISDDSFFFPNATPTDMMRFYCHFYEHFNTERYFILLSKFGLEGTRRIATFSKGMKKQLSMIYGICANTKYLLCDETFDGLDPVMRQAVKRIIVGEIEDRNMTPIIASHNLRELEDICDYVGVLHKGGILLSKDLDEMKTHIHKVQCVFTDITSKHSFFKMVDAIITEERGSLYTITIRGTREQIENKLSKVNTIFAEIIPLSLEEIFISETEAAGYDIRNIIS